MTGRNARWWGGRGVRGVRYGVGMGLYSSDVWVWQTRSWEKECRHVKVVLFFVAPFFRFRERGVVERGRTSAARGS